MGAPVLRHAARAHRSPMRQTLRLVGDNMAWLLRSMTAAREAGVVPYEREVRVKTNFYKPEAAPNVQGEG